MGAVLMAGASGKRGGLPADTTPARKLMVPMEHSLAPRMREELARLLHGHPPDLLHHLVRLLVVAPEIPVAQERARALRVLHAELREVDHRPLLLRLHGAGHP